MMSSMRGVAPEHPWELVVKRGVRSAYHQYREEDQYFIDTYLDERAHGISSELEQIPPILMIDDNGVSASLASLSKAFQLSFTEGEIGRRAHQRAETLCRVTGASRGEMVTILDATAGLGRDSYLMASCGARVFAFERNLALYLLARYALMSSPHQFQLILGDSVSRWSELGAEADVIYLDPMFPVKHKRAAVGREAQVLQAFAAPNAPDDDRLLTWALDTALRRVVVKRPLKAPPLAGPRPTANVRGRAIRFDLYGKRKLP